LNNIIEAIREKFITFLGLGKLRDEINVLKADNAQLEITVKDHEKTIAVLAILQAKTMKEVLNYFDIASKTSRKTSSPIIKKVDDDIIN
jgi:hypothetical protein